MRLALGMACGSAVALLAAGGVARTAEVVFSDAGPSGADVMDTLEAFQINLSNTGGAAVDNGLGGGPHSNGIRHVDWDLVTTELADPNQLPGDYFNSTAPVGMQITTLGDGFMVSARPGEGAEPRFGDLNPQYPAIFQSFGGERIFAPVMSTVTDITFFLPGSPGVPAWVNGFGAIFLDVDTASGLNPTIMEFWDLNGKSLGHWHAEAADEGVTFLGVTFDPGVHVGRVRINNGDIPPFAGVDDGLGGVVDIVAMGPFFFGEPMAIPEPGTFGLALMGFALLSGVRRSQRLGTPVTR